jgi:hypothetical protein
VEIFGEKEKQWAAFVLEIKEKTISWSNPGSEMAITLNFAEALRYCVLSIDSNLTLSLFQLDSQPLFIQPSDATTLPTAFHDLSCVTIIFFRSTDHDQTLEILR